MSKKRKSFLEQLFDMLVDGKNLNNKNIIILMIILVIIAITGIVLSLPAKYEDDMGGINYFTTEYNYQVLESIGYSKAEIEDMDEDTIYELANDIIIRTNNQIAGDEWKEELPYSESIDIKAKFYQYAIAGNYEQILNDYENLKLKYYLSEPYNKELIRIYNDAYIINSALSDKNNLIQQKDTLTKINNEKMLLCMFLKSNLETRNNILKDRLSLTLSNDDDNLRINSVTSATMYYNAKNHLYENDVYLTKMFEYLNEGSFIIYKINFSLGEDTFYAYMFKDLTNFKLSIYGIYPDEKTSLNSSYVTVVESEEILSNIYNYNNSIKDTNNNSDAEAIQNNNQYEPNDFQSEDDTYPEDISGYEQTD